MIYQVYEYEERFRPKCLVSIYRYSSHRKRCFFRMSSTAQHHRAQSDASFCCLGGRILPEHTWKSFLGLELLGEDDAMFQEIGAKFVMFAEEWADWYQSPCPEEESLPGDFVTAGEMQTLCIVRVLRPDRITFALRKFVAGFLGEDFVSQPPFSMRSVYEDSSASTPILFLLFPGVDPSAWVEDLGREMGITTSSEMLSNTSMGEKGSE